MGGRNGDAFKYANKWFINAAGEETETDFNTWEKSDNDDALDQSEVTTAAKLYPIKYIFFTAPLIH